MKSKSAASVLGIVALVVTSAACSSDGAGDGVPSTPNADTATSTVTDLGEGWSLEHPDDWTVDGTFGRSTEQSPGCTSTSISVSHDKTTTDIALVDRACSADPIGRGNGQQPTFGNGDQLSDAVDVEEVTTPLGNLTVATVDYYECTNECNYWKPNVGVIDVDDPSDPVVVISNDYDVTDREDIEFIAQHLSRN